MFLRLQQKLFYFVTDPKTNYTFLIDNSKKPAQRYLYYPNKFQTMSTNNIRVYKQNLVLKLLKWAIFNKNMMIKTDFQMCFSKIIDMSFSLFLSFVMGRYCRKLLFRLEFPFIEAFIESKGIQVKWAKAMTAYTIGFFVGYRWFRACIQDSSLCDIALEYKYHFDYTLECTQCDPILLNLCQQRFHKMIDNIK